MKHVCAAYKGFLVSSNTINAKRRPHLEELIALRLWKGHWQIGYLKFDLILFGNLLFSILSMFYWCQRGIFEFNIRGLMLSPSTFSIIHKARPRKCYKRIVTMLKHTLLQSTRNFSSIYEHFWEIFILLCLYNWSSNFFPTGIIELFEAAKSCQVQTTTGIEDEHQEN